MLSIRIYFFMALSLTAIRTVAQHEAADKKIQAIDLGKKYTVEKLGAEELKKSNSSADTSQRVLEVISFSSRKYGLQKVIHRSRFQGNAVTRICYFGTDNRIFAIRDSILYADKTKKVFTYYLGARQFSVTDENRKDVTSTIDRDELYEWILSVFSDQEIDDWRLVR